MLRHVFKVDGDGRAFQVVNALGADHHELPIIVILFCLCCEFTGLALCTIILPLNLENFSIGAAFIRISFTVQLCFDDFKQGQGGFLIFVLPIFD